MLKQYWRCYLGIGMILFIIVLIWSYIAQSPRYRVEGLVEIGRTPVLADGKMDIEMVMSAAATKDLVRQLSQINVSNNLSGDSRVDPYLGVRVNNRASLVVRATATSPDKALQIYNNAIQDLLSRHEHIFQERLAYEVKVYETLKQDLDAHKKLIADLKGCGQLGPGEARSRCLALLERTMKSIEIETPRVVSLGRLLLPEHSYPTRQVGEVRSPATPFSPDLKISVLLAIYVSLLGVASLNLLLCLRKPS